MVFAVMVSSPFTTSVTFSHPLAFKRWQAPLPAVLNRTSDASPDERHSRKIDEINICDVFDLVGHLAFKRNVIAIGYVPVGLLIFESCRV